MSTLQTQVAALGNELREAKLNYDAALDTIWTLLAAALVFFMTTGFSMLETGSVRFKHTNHILAKNLIVVTCGFLCWWAVGYSFALGATEEPNKFIGSTGFFTQGPLLDTSNMKVWFFQGTFCATAATIVSGAMAERTHMLGFATYTVFMTSIIYPIGVYWGWSGKGFLNFSDGEGEARSVVGPPLVDFAGSGFVHLVGGVGALCGTIIVGSRKGRFDPASAHEFTGHSIPFIVLGTFFLWFGWYGFNPGSTASMHDKDTANLAGLVAVNTTLSPCVGGLVVFILRKTVVWPRELDLAGFCNGILAGLVSITAGCAVVQPWEAVVIGFIGAVLYQGTSMLILSLQVDDVVDAAAVHGACGLWGILAAGLFGNPAKGMGGNGALYGGNQLGVQILDIVILTAWSGSLSTPTFFWLRKIGILRLSDKEQDSGVDAPKMDDGSGPLSFHVDVLRPDDSSTENI